MNRQTLIIWIFISVSFFYFVQWKGKYIDRSFTKELRKWSSRNDLTKPAYHASYFINIPKKNNKPTQHSSLNISRKVEKSDTKTYILPLGDSITQGSGVPGGYRGYLFDKLSERGYDITYVGTKKKNCFQPCTLKIKSHEGHGGKMLNFFLDNIENWMETYIHPPDIVLLLVGTTEFADQAYDMDNAINKWDDLIEKISEFHPYAHIIASNLIDRAERFNPNIHKYFNPYVRDIIKKHANAGRRVTFLDLHSIISVDLLEDQLHPTEEGYNIMADSWMDAIVDVIGPNGDYYPPEVTNVEASSDGKIFVSFSKPMSDESIDLNNFFISNGVSVLDADLDDGKRQIILMTSGLSYIGKYIIKLTSLTDRTSLRNTLLDETLEFSSSIQFDKYIPLPQNPPMIAPHGSCQDQKGLFKNMHGVKQRCKDLDHPYKLIRNCGSEYFPRTELGIACPQSCSKFYSCETNNPTDAPQNHLTKSPVITSIQNENSKCYDNAGKFRINFRHGHKDCNFIAKNRIEFCDWKFIKEYCPLTCGYCIASTCKDSIEPLYLPNAGRSRNCSFVKTKPGKYCKWAIFKSHCPETCEQCTTKSPKSKCVDNTESFFVSSIGETRDCKHIQRNISKFCKWNVYKTNCPKSCNQCICRDTKEKFKLNKNSSGWKTCEVIGKFKEKYCKWRVPKKMCPVTCNQCST